MRTREEMLKQESFSVTKDDLSKQIRKTAVIFAFDMLLLKFIQGIPVVGALGGAANQVYYNKVMKYVELKYRKRYLMKIKEQTPDRDLHENSNPIR